MAEKQTNVITLDDIEYSIDDMNATQKTLLAHVQDLERKINSAKFNLDQLVVGREGFITALAKELKQQEEA